MDFSIVLLGFLCKYMLLQSIFNGVSGSFSLFGDHAKNDYNSLDFNSLENAMIADDASFNTQRIRHRHAKAQEMRRFRRTSNKMDPDEGITPDNYIRHVAPPKINGSAVPVNFTVLIFQVRDIKEIDQEITLELRLQVYWKDTRLDNLWGDKFFAGKNANRSYASLHLGILQKIWFPDIFIDFVKKVEQPKLMETVPASIRYYKEEKYIRYSGRITILMSCEMKFQYYPADTQSCPIEIKSYAYTDDVLHLAWHGDRGPLQLVEESVDSPNFEVNLDKPTLHCINTFSGHSYTGIRFSVLLKRKISYHMIQTFVPSTLFVFVSWLSFLVPPESVPGRMAMFSAVRQNIPKVSYVKALDIWMVACAFFVFLTLVEYTIVLKLKSKIPQSPTKPIPDKRKQSRVSGSVTLPYRDDTPAVQVRKVSGVGERNNQEADEVLDDFTEEKVKPNKYAVIVKNIEKYTWMIVVVLFILFNLIYWPWLMYSSDYLVVHDKTEYYKSNLQLNGTTNPPCRT